MASPLRTAAVVVRDALTLAMIVLAAPLWLMARCEQALTGGETIFQFCAELLSLAPGKPGVYLRRGYYCMALDRFPWDGHVGFGTTASHRTLRVGRRVYIGNCCTLGSASIGDDATIGSNVDILSGRRQHFFGSVGQPIQQQGGAFEQITIGRNCWIGNSAVIMADIGDDTIVGAGSVVVKPLPPLVVAAGNPARVVRNRYDSESHPAATELKCTGS